MTFTDKELEKRKHLVKTTYKLVADYGFSNITLQDVAEKAGVSKGSILYYFENKDELFVTLLERMVNNIERQIRVNVSRSNTPQEKLQAFINSTFVGIKENRDFYKVYLDFLSQSNHNDGLKKFNVYWYEQCVLVFGQIAKEGIEKGVFRNVAPEAAAIVARSVVDGLCIRWLFDEPDRFEFYKETALQVMTCYLSK